MSKQVSIVGGGPAGALAAILLAKNSNHKVRIFDTNKPLKTLLPTGGGRCNLSYYEPDVSEFVKFYPRGEKFLMSVFSQFNSLDCMSLFEEFGIKTYIQDDLRIFPESNSSKDVVIRLVNELKKNKVEIIEDKVVDVIKNEDCFSIKTQNSQYDSDFVILSTGGKGNGFKLAEKLGHKIDEIRPSLCPLRIKNKEFYELSGLSLNNINIKVYFNNREVCSTFGDFLFTHTSISGPAVFKVSSLCAYYDFNKNNPLILKINILGLSEEEVVSFIEEAIKANPNKAVKNVLSKIVNKNLLNLILDINNINPDKQIVHISKIEKNNLIKSLTSLELSVTERLSGGEIVTAGGVCLDEINSKTMESKITKGLYFTGEIINVDGFTGGFNLQNCWSTAYVCAKALSVS